MAKVEDSHQSGRVRGEAAERRAQRCGWEAVEARQINVNERGQFSEGRGALGRMVTSAVSDSKRICTFSIFCHEMSALVCARVYEIETSPPF